MAGPKLLSAESINDKKKTTWRVFAVNRRQAKNRALRASRRAFGGISSEEISQTGFVDVSDTVGNYTMAVSDNGDHEVASITKTVSGMGINEYEVEIITDSSAKTIGEKWKEAFMSGI